MSFEDIGVPTHASEVLRRQGIIEPNAVQLRAIPPLSAGKDTVLHAPTGSGKTLAYLLPLVRRLGQRSGDGPRAIIIAPTRELATQIDTVLQGLQTNLRSVPVFGGVPYGNQLRALRARPDVVIGCPGRLLDVLRRGATNLRCVEYLVLDESDEMLDQGFAYDVEKIIARTPTTRQTVLASATMPDWVQTMITKHLRHPAIIHVELRSESALEHALVAVSQQSKTETLDRLLRTQNGQAIVFHRTKHGTKKLARALNGLGHSVAELQGNLSQNARDRALASFRSGQRAVLVATDVAARGIDVAEVGLVVNFELPQTAEWLTHRIGRTARNGVRGRALTFVTPEDGAKWIKLRRQGAPDLAHLDLGDLLERGQWSLQPRVNRTNTHPASRSSGAPWNGRSSRSVNGSATTRSHPRRQRRRGTDSRRLEPAQGIRWNSSNGTKQGKQARRIAVQPAAGHG